MLTPVKEVFVLSDRQLLKSILTILVLLTAFLMLLPNSDFNGIDTDDVSLIDRLISRLHLAMATVSSVGYGDIVPKSRMARFVCIIAQLMIMLEPHTSIRDVYTARACVDHDYNCQQITSFVDDAQSASCGESVNLNLSCG